jgi:hypothetical protein
MGQFFWPGRKQSVATLRLTYPLGNQASGKQTATPAVGLDLTAAMPFHFVHGFSVRPTPDSFERPAYRMELCILAYLMQPLGRAPSRNIG